MMLTSCEQKYADVCLIGGPDNIAIISDMLNTKNKWFNNEKLLTKCLHNACEGGHLEIVKIILNYKNVINYESNLYSCKIPTLFYAMKGGNNHIINIVGDIDAKPPTKRGYYCKIWEHGYYGACVSGRLDILKAYRNNVFYIAPFLNKCLMYACQSDNNLDTINYLISKGATDWDSGLKSACRYGCIKNAELMIKSRLINLPNRLQSTNPVQTTESLYNVCLHEACVGGHMKLFELMISKGAETSYCFDYACIGGNIDIINFLMKNGNCYIFHSPALDRACEGGNVEIAKVIISKGGNYVNINHSLYIACVYGHVDAAKFMISIGASNFNICLRHACLRGDLDLIKMLTIHSQNVNTDWLCGLKSACKSQKGNRNNNGIKCGGNIEVVKFMLENGTYEIEDLNNAMKVTDKNDTHILNLLVSKGGNYLSRIKNAKDFRLYCTYHKSLSHKYINTSKYVIYIRQYPPYVLFIGSRITQSVKCRIKILPTELFRLLVGFV